MSGSAVLLGLALGVRHATDADHVAAIGALLGERGVRGAVATAALWGAGHSATFGGLGLAVVGLGLRLPAGFERGVELLVAAMLVGLGLAQLVAGRGGAAAKPASPRGPGGGRGWRPVLVGVVHGLAGSAGVALVALTTMPSRASALVYLLLFGVGVVAGMMALTALMAWPLAWSARRAGAAHRALKVGASAASVAMGVAVALEAC